MIKDEVWDLWANDMSVKEHYKPDLSSRSVWLKMMINGELAGVVLVGNYNLTTLKMHPYILKCYRKYSRTLSTKLLTMFMGTPKFINKLVLEIPFHRRIVYNLAKKMGFIDEGINRGSFLKDGVYYDQWNLGLTKNEIRCLL